MIYSFGLNLKPKEFPAITDEGWFKFFEVNVLSGVSLSCACFDKMIAKKLGSHHFAAATNGTTLRADGGVV